MGDGISETKGGEFQELGHDQSITQRLGTRNTEVRAVFGIWSFGGLCAC